jgi:hypothetical protein
MKFLFFLLFNIVSTDSFLFPNNYYPRNTNSKLFDNLYPLPTIRCVAYIHRNYTNTNSTSFMIDIDGTICNTHNSDYLKSIPRAKNIAVFNKLYDQGHQIHYWTARGANSGKNWDEFTIMQLKQWNVKFTTINMGKPHYDIWIDDKAINANDVSPILLGLDPY